MAQIVKLKRTSVAGRIPTTSNIEVGELAFNSNDKSLFIRGDSNAIVAIHDESTLHIDTTNNRVGIGTTSPNEPLHIVNSDPKIKLEDSDGTNQVSTIFHSGSVLAFQSRNNTANGTIKFSGFDGTTVTEYARFNASGRLGIGTTSPSRRLHVKDSNYRVALFERTGAPNCFITFADPNTTQDVGVGATTNDLKFRSGNVDHLSLLGSNGHLKFTDFDQQLEFGSTSNKLGYNQWLMSASGGASIKNVAGPLTINPDDFTAFQVNDVEKARINATGLGIGTTSPDTSLDITTAGAEGIILNQDTGNTSVSSRVFFKDGTSTSALLNVGGNFEIRTGAGVSSSSGTRRLVVKPNGTITFNEAYTFPSSDGSANQVLQTDGSGNLSFATVQAGGGGTVSEAFKTIAVSGQDNVVAEAATDTLTFAAGTGMTITTNASSDTVTFAASSSDFTDSDGDTKIQVEESSDEDIIRFDAGGEEVARMQHRNNEVFLDLVRRGVPAATANLSFSGIGLNTNVTSGYHSLVVQNNGSEQFRVDSSGKVGIGSSSPQAHLDVASGTIRARGLSTIGSGAGTELRYISGSNAGGIIVFDRSTSSYEELRLEGSVIKIKESGTDVLTVEGQKVGIGTSAPSSVLHISDASSPEIRLEDSDATSTFNQIAFQNAAGNFNLNTRQDNGTFVSTDYQIVKNAAGANIHKWFIGNAEKVRLDASGRLGIGTTAPSAKLDVNGTIRTNLIQTRDTSLSAFTFIDLDMDTGGSAGTNNLVLGGVNNVDFLVDTNNNGTTGAFVFGKDANTMSSATELMRLNESGNLGIGESAPSQKLQVNGNIRADGHYYVGGNIVINSSRALQNITTINTSSTIVAGSTIHRGNLTIESQEIDVGSGDFTLDVAGDITLDADGGDVRLKDNGTEFLNFYAGAIERTGGSLNFDVAGNITLNADGSTISLNDDTINFGQFFNNASGQFNIFAPTQDKDIVFLGNDGGSTITALTLDMSASGAATFNDQITIGSGSNIINAGNMTLDVGGDITLDAGGANINFNDDGTAVGHIEMAGSNLEIKSKVSDKDIIFKGNDGGSTITALTLDMSDAGKATFNSSIDCGNITSTGTINMNHDSATLFLGADIDMRIKHDGSNGTIQNDTGDLTLDVAGNLVLDADGGTIDLMDGGTRFGRLQQMIGGLGISAGSAPTFQQLLSSTKTLFFGHIETGDNKHIRLGSGNGDLQLIHDGSNSYIEAYGTGNLIIKQSTDDADISFQSDNGSGGVTEYLRLDGANVQMVASQKLAFNDNVRATFGNSSDLQIYHDSSSGSIIEDVGSGTLDIRTNGTRAQFSKNGTEFIAKFIPDGAVELFYDNSKKIETTSSGINVTGNIVNTGDTDFGGRGDFAKDLRIRGDGSTANQGVVRFHSNSSSRLSIDPGNDGSNVFFFDTSGNLTVPGNLTLSGNLTVNGTQTILNTATLDVEDKNITLNKGSGDTSGSADGAGITIQDAVNASTNATILWNQSISGFKFSHDIRLDDDLRLEFGDSSDLIIRHANNNRSYISGNDIEISTNSFRLFNLAGTTGMITATTSGVSLLQNTSVTGSLSVTGNISSGIYEIGDDTTSTSSTSQTTISQFSASSVRSCRFTVQVTNSTDSTFHTTELLLVHDGTTPGITEFGTIFTGAAAEATFDADISSGNVRLRATPASSDSMTFKVVRHMITT